MSNVIDVINERISCADSFLSKLTALTRIPRPSNNSGVISIDYKVRYDNVQVNQIKDELSKWQFVTKELLIKHFGEDHRFTKRFDDTIIEHKVGRDYKAELTRETEDGINSLKSIIESIHISGYSPEIKPIEETTKAPLVFISHSSKDRAFVEALVELLEGIGLDEKTLFCSSIPGYWIGLSKDIYEALLSLFTNRLLYVIFVQSPNFYSSHVSLNEMGAAWALKAKYCSILTPEMEFSAMTAVVNSHEVAIKVNNADAKPRLTELKNTILEFLGKPAISDFIWERKRDNFLRAVDPSYVSDSPSSLSVSEEYQQLMVEKMKKEKEDLLKASIKGNIFQASLKGGWHLRVFNAGKSTAKNIKIEWLNEDNRVIVHPKFEPIDDLTPQNRRDYRITLINGHPQTMRLKYTWDDDFKTENTFEESLQL